MSMKKIIVYFHGYGSSPESTKTQMLRDAGYETYSWKIDVDPRVSLTNLSIEIDDLMMDYLNEEVEFVFVGTSLGGWYAYTMGKMYGIKSVLINPSYDPNPSLRKYGVDPDVCAQYTPIDFDSVNCKVFIGNEDTVINFDGVYLGKDVVYVDGASHRFTEKFDVVLDYLAKD